MTLNFYFAKKYLFSCLKIFTAKPKKKTQLPGNKSSAASSTNWLNILAHNPLCSKLDKLYHKKIRTKEVPANGMAINIANVKFTGNGKSTRLRQRIPRRRINEYRVGRKHETFGNKSYDYKLVLSTKLPVNIMDCSASLLYLKYSR